MFVSIIFDVEFMGVDERHKWFLKSLSHAKENDWFVITHEHLGKHYQEYVDNCKERFFDEFEMSKLSNEEYESISKGFVPDYIFNSREEILGARTAFLIDLFENRYEELEKYLIYLIEDELSRRPNEKVEGIFNCLDTIASVTYLGEYFNCPVIPYVFSAIRKVHGYSQTLYMTAVNGALYASTDAKSRYERFLSEKNNGCIFSRRELLALLGKKHNFLLLKLLDCEPKYELGVCANAYSINPESFPRFAYTDDDIYYEGKKIFKMDAIKTRMHPMVYDSLGIGREHLKNDPASFILSCRRVTSVKSQMLLKAMLWNRAVYMKGDFLQLSYLCEKDIESINVVDLEALNYYIFGFLIPSSLMFDVDYWRWRINDTPTETEIYNKHLMFYLGDLGLDKYVINCKDEQMRFISILKARKCEEYIMKMLLENTTPKNIDFEVLMSKLEIGNNADKAFDFSCINETICGAICSEFQFTIDEKMDAVRFYPFIDIGAKAKIEEILIDGKVVQENTNYKYYSKSNGFEDIKNVELTAGNHNIRITWNYSFQ